MITIYLVILLCCTITGSFFYCAGMLRTEQKLIRHITSNLTEYSEPIAQDITAEIVEDILTGKYRKSKQIDITLILRKEGQLGMDEYWLLGLVVLLGLLDYLRYKRNQEAFNKSIEPLSKQIRTGLLVKTLRSRTPLNEIVKSLNDLYALQYDKVREGNNSYSQGYLFAKLVAKDNKSLLWYFNRQLVICNKMKVTTRFDDGVNDYLTTKGYGVWYWWKR